MLDFLAQSQYIFWGLIFVALVLFALISRSFLHFAKMLFNNLHASTGAIFSSAGLPLLFLSGVWLVQGLHHIMQSKWGNTLLATDEFIAALKHIGVISVPIAFGWFALRFLSRLRITLAHKPAPADVNWALLIKIAQILVVVLVSLMLADKWGFNINSVLTVGGIGGVALGLAAKDSMANFFGSLIISIDRPFSIGDYIYSPDREIEGRVTEIGWRFTRVTNPDGMDVHIPNSLFTNIIICNRTKVESRRLRFKVRLGYHGSIVPALLVKELEKNICALEEVEEDGTAVLIESMGSFVIELDVIVISKIITLIGILELKHKIFLLVEELSRGMSCELISPISILELHLTAGGR